MNPYLTGLAFGLLTAILLLVIIFIIKKKRNSNYEYDERQLLARNAAYKYSFSTLLFYMILCAWLDVVEITWATIYVQMYLGLSISIGVLVIICILKDAYFSYKKKNPISFLALLVIIIALNVIAVIMYIADGESFVTDGMLNSHCLNVIFSLLFTVIFIVLIIKNAINKKAIEED